MPAIGYTKTATSDDAWDAGENEKQLSNDEKDLRAAFAWVDPAEDPTTKAAYKFIHHFVNGDGSVGAASLVACSSGIGVLNGGRGGTTIPEADKAGVHAHLAHHLEDAGKEAPELKARRFGPERAPGGDGRGPSAGDRSPNDLRAPLGAGRGLAGAGRGQATSAGERLERMTPGRVQVRAQTGGSPLICGHGATFNVMTSIDTWFGPYQEKVAPGCFSKTIADGADVRCLWNHDPNYVLGRTKSGTLSLEEDDVGLAYAATPPATQWAMDLCTSMERGDVDGSSFGFRVIRDKWTMVLDPEGDQENDLLDCRTLLEVQLYDVSPVTFPAYAESESALRAQFARGGVDLAALGRLIYRADNGLRTSPRDVDAVRAALEYLKRYLPEESSAARGAPARTSHPPATPHDATAPTSHASRALYLRLDALEKIALGR